ncbi:hypothetical protein EDC14_101122 [Hydrogenispora ethanolica]|uniref:Uncharacterized protein n=1 Tax=Hydrogenispora ethanolica TaxID=1082276 RepID=A0A4R1RTP3_HYDET|nr:hypothetical protein [Hydrogenispora ethanolica]TCL69901.1 hypothetical protein EDC14_101122 [Hydrogenispora ethanolica]
MKKFFILICIALIALLFQIQCLAMNTVASTEIPNADKKLIIDATISDMVNRGFSVVSVNEYQISFKRDLFNVPKAMLFDPKLNGTPEGRITLNIVQVNRNVRIVAEAKIFTNPNSGYERSFPVDAKYIQPLLDDMKYKFIGAIKFQIKWSSL